MIKEKDLLKCLINYIEQNFMNDDFIEFMEANGYLEKEVKETLSVFEN